LAKPLLSIAATSGKPGISLRSVGTISARLMPTPPPRPSTKKYGGPPSGIGSETKTKKEVYSPSSSVGLAYEPMAVKPRPATSTISAPS
jgi:hypothetical protein